MVKNFKTVLILISYSILLGSLCSCFSHKEPQVYTNLYSVIKSDMGGKYFASDEGINLYPANGTFDSRWGAEGDRVVVGFYYNPYTVTEYTTRLDINVENLTLVPTYSSALPSTVDTIGTGVFLYSDGQSSDTGIGAWAAQNYLTAVFLIRYTDPTKHIFGFVEDENLFRNDTLFLNLWHNTKETGNTQIARSHVAVNLSNYDGYLWGRDSTVISIKYKAERLDTSTPATYTYNAMYRRKYNSNGLY